MIKKLLTFVLFTFCSIELFSAPRNYNIYGDIGPAVYIGTGTIVTLPAAGTGVYNCLEYLVANSTNTYSILILNGNTTFYQMTRSASDDMEEIFQLSPLCGSANTAMTIKNNPASGTNGETNYKGFLGK